jgi:hypothetical protein
LISHLRRLLPTGLFLVAHRFQSLNVRSYSFVYTIKKYILTIINLFPLLALITSATPIPVYNGDGPSDGGRSRIQEVDFY